MKVLVLAEYYPRAGDPVSGVWAHRQALAARDAGAELRVLVLHRPLPPLRALRGRDLDAIQRVVAQPRSVELDGLRVDYLRYLSPPRPWSYATWGAWAAPVLKRALARVKREFPFELVHAHYAVPAGDALRRAAPRTPMVLSIHGGDVHGAHAGSAAVSATLAHAQLVLANSAGTARRCRALGAHDVRVVHLGADIAAGGGVHLGANTAARGGVGPSHPTLVSVGHLIARKRHADVIAALPAVRERHPDVRYVIVGDGPERESLLALAARLGVAGSVQLLGQFDHTRAVAEAQAGTLFVLPSVAEAFGVGYIEAMAGSVPAIGCHGEDGPEEIAAAGGGIELVPPRDPPALAATIERLLSDPDQLAALGREAALTAQHAFTWERCGRETVSAYEDVLCRAR